ncbi:MAG: hypothetical protein WB217_13490, partial [Mesobacillus sp.]|uniref:hypothetical protein n=1 Tax=Mesobacillus sp. TaxID=2675271 RepID=UPI003C3F2A0B
ALDSSENANAFPSYVGRFKEAVQSPARSAAKASPRRSKMTRWFTGRPAESEPGADINCQGYTVKF